MLCGFMTLRDINHVFIFPVPRFSKRGHGLHVSESRETGGREVKRRAEERTVWLLRLSHKEGNNISTCWVVRIGNRSPEWRWLKDRGARENGTKESPRT